MHESTILAAMVDLNEMVVFARVVARGSFAAVARELSVPPSTISRRIASLEGRLGIRLLERTTRSLRLTEAGTAYHPACAQIAREAEAADRAVGEILLGPRGLLRVSAPPAFVDGLVAPTVAEYLRRYPEVRAEIASDDRAVDLTRDGFDLVFRVAPSLPDASFVARRIGSTAMILVATPLYLERHGEPRRPQQLGAHAILGFGRERPKVSWTLLSAGRRVTKLTLTPRALSNSDAGLAALCRADLGIAILSPSFAAEGLATGAFRRVLAGHVVEARQVYVVMPRSSQAAPKVRAYLDVVDAFLRERPQTLDPFSRGRAP